VLLRRVVQAVQADAFDEIAQSTRYIRRDVKRLIRQVVKEATELHVKRGMSIPEARRQVAKRLESIGLRAFRDASGRRWKLKTYSEMVARTRTATAYNTGLVVQATAEGVEVFEVFDGTQDDICARANGTKVTADWALDNPIGHPNCTRGIAPVAGVPKSEVAA
jgi:hypothetical protein